MSTKTKFTPGPWGCKDTSNHSHDYRLTTPNGKANLPLTVINNDHSEQRANAKLIAASPTMYSVLEALLDWAECHCDLTGNEEAFGCQNDDELVAARKILAKAVGDTTNGKMED